jgi:hypothetical protein
VVFAVVITGAPGSGKTATLIGLSDALADTGVAHAVVDVDDVARAFPYPDDAGRLELLRDCCASHRRRGASLFLVAEVVETPAALRDLLDAVGADEHLLVRLVASPAVRRERIIAREPPGWSGLEHLLALSDAHLDGLGEGLVLDTERCGPQELGERIRAALPQ